MTDLACPTFSIIIPCYNYEEYVRRAIDSVLSQSFKDFELLVVDDGSEDGSWQAIESYGEAIIAFRSKNQGAASNCLAMARKAKGRYLYVLDADDELAPGALETLFKHIHGEPAKIQFPLTPIDDGNRVIGEPYPKFPQNYTRAQMLREIERNGSYLTGPTSGNLFRADIFALIEDIPYERYIDGVSYLLCPYVGDVVTLYEPLAKYRVHSRNASGFSSLEPAWLATQRERFTMRLKHLREICDRLGLPGDAIPDGDQTAYVQERRIMEMIASGKPVPLSAVFDFWSKLARTIGPLKPKLAVGAWALASSMALAGFRKTLLNWRYNPWSRPTLLRRFAASMR